METKAINKLRAIKLCDKYWSLIEQRSRSFGVIKWIEPNGILSGLNIGDDVYLKRMGGEELGNYKNILYRQKQDFNLSPKELLELNNLINNL